MPRFFSQLDGKCKLAVSIEIVVIPLVRMFTHCKLVSGNPPLFSFVKDVASMTT